MVKRICEECEKEFFTHACYLKRGGGRFCSIECCNKPNICKVEGCNKKVHGNEFCAKHYMRIRVHGTLDIECVGQSRKGERNGMFGVHRTGKDVPFFGKRHTKESIEKIRLAHIGKKHSDESNKKRSGTLKGRVFTKEHKAKIGDAHRGKIVPKESVEKMRIALTGRKLSLEHREKLSGYNSSNWKGGITPINAKLRNTIELKEWRFSVYKRDNFTCVICGIIGGKLNADHIKPFALYPDLRLDLNNGRTLCVPCHKKTDTYGKKSMVKNKN